MPEDEKKQQPRENPKEERPDSGRTNLNESRLPDIRHERSDDHFNKGGLPDNTEYIGRPPVSETPPSKED